MNPDDRKLDVFRTQVARFAEPNLLGFYTTYDVIEIQPRGPNGVRMRGSRKHCCGRFQTLHHQWFETKVQCDDAWYRLLSRLQPYAYALRARSERDWMAQQEIELPFDPTKDIYTKIKYGFDVSIRARLERLRGRDGADSRKVLNLTWTRHVDPDHAAAA